MRGELWAGYSVSAVGKSLGVDVLPKEDDVEEHGGLGGYLITKVKLIATVGTNTG